MLEYDNSPTQEVLELSIRAQPESECSSIPLVQRGQVDFNSLGQIHITVVGDEQSGVDLKDELRRITDGTRVWYAWLTNILSSGVLAGIVFAVWLTALTAVQVMLRVSGPDERYAGPTPPFYEVFFVSDCVGCGCLCSHPLL